MIASSNGHLAVIEYLVECGADVEGAMNVSDVTVPVKPPIRHT